MDSYFLLTRLIYFFPIYPRETFDLCPYCHPIIKIIITITKILYLFYLPMGLVFYFMAWRFLTFNLYILSEFLYPAITFLCSLIFLQTVVFSFMNRIVSFIHLTMIFNNIQLLNIQVFYFYNVSNVQHIIFLSLKHDLLYLPCP